MFSLLFGSADRPPIFLELRSSKAFIITTVSLAIFTDVFLYAIIVPVLPFALTTRAHVDPSSIQTWISILLAVFGAALLLVSPLLGWLADRTESRRWPMLGGLLALLGATAMLCFGRSIAVIILARVIQGVSGAVVWIVGLALLADTVGVGGIGEAMGYVGLGLSGATLLAPCLGGLVFARAGYYAVFAMAFAVIGVDIFLRVMMIEKKIAVKWLPLTPVIGEEVQSPDSVVRECISNPESCDTTNEKKEATQTEQELTENQAELDLAEETSARAEGGPTADEAKIKPDLPPILTLLSSRRLLSALWTCTTVSTLYTALDSTLPLFVRDTFHWNSFGAGLIFIPIFIACLLGPTIGTLSDRHGPRWFTAAGLILAAPVFVLLRLVNQNNIQHKILLCALLTLAGACLTLVITPIMAEVTYAVEAKEQRRPKGYFGKNGAYAQAYGWFNMAWAAGSMLGPLVGGLTRGSIGWDGMTIILGGIAMVTVVPAVIWTGGSIFKMKKLVGSGEVVSV